MITFLVSANGTAHFIGPASSHNGRLGLPKGMSLSDIIRHNKNSGKVCDLLVSTSIQPAKLVESAKSVGSSWSRRGPHFETKCHLATEREPKREEGTISESSFPSSGQDKKPFSRFSHFLREITRQEVWAGLLDPFQTSGGNSSHVNCLIQELNLRTETTSGSSNLTMESTSDIISQLLVEHNTPSRSVSFYPESDSVFLSAARITTSANSAVDFLTYSTETLSTGSGSYTGVKNYELTSAPALKSSVDFQGLKPSTTAKSYKHVLREVSEGDLSHSSTKCVTAQDIGSAENLARWLDHRIGSSLVSQWGVAPGTKQVANLWCELVEGEISLQDSSPPKRFTHVISVKIKNEEGDVLVESHQEMADGRKRPRNRPLSEKVRPGEHVEEACLRGISEELGCHLGASDRVVMFPESYRRDEEERESFSYPGLPTRYVIHTMVAHIEQLPSTEFSTEEDETNHGGSPAGLAALSGSELQKKAVGVKRHFWRWVPEHRLAELCRR